MTTFINAPVLTELKNALKLGLVPENPEAIELLQTVQPVVMVPDWRVTGTLVGGKATLNLDVPGLILIPAYVCPSGKRAYLLLASKPDTSAVSQIIARLGGADVNISHRQTGDEIVRMNGELWLEADDTLGLRSTDDPGDTARDLTWIVVEASR